MGRPWRFSCNENGAFPTLIAITGMFFSGGRLLGGQLGAACILAGMVLGSVALTFLSSRLLSATVLRGEASSFLLELPPYRRPQIGKVLLRSMLDRTLFVLGRATAVAAPAGLVLWLLTHITTGGQSLLYWCAAALEAPGRALGLDGAILLAFVLGLPANELVLPIMLMLYTGAAGMLPVGDLQAVKVLLLAHGWTLKTAICTVLFMQFHWPCSTTLLTIYRETGRWKWVWVAALLPLLFGAGLCLLVNAAAGLLGL